MTCDMWHVTCDRWGEMHLLSKFQLPSSNGLGFMMLWRLEVKGSLSHWINDEGVGRTAPANPSLLNILININTSYTTSSIGERCDLCSNLSDVTLVFGNYIFFVFYVYYKFYCKEAFAAPFNMLNVDDSCQSPLTCEMWSFTVCLLEKSTFANICMACSCLANVPKLSS